MDIQETTQQPEISVLPFLGENPSVLDLCLQYRFSADTLAFIADVDEQVVHEMFGYRPVCKVDAQKVLTVLSEILKQVCTFENVDVPLLEDEGEGESNGQIHIL